MSQTKVENLKGGGTENLDMRQVGELDLDESKLQNGPVSDRSCTDCICCLVFVAFLVGMGFCAIYGFAKGDPVRLLTGWDTDGKSSKYLTFLLTRVTMRFEKQHSCHGELALSLLA